MITLNVVTTMRRICEEVESVLDYGFTDLNMRVGVMNLTHAECRILLFFRGEGDSGSEFSQRQTTQFFSLTNTGFNH